MNIRRRPKRSPARPPSKSRPPNASAYPLTTHSRSVASKFSARWIDGSATFTIVVSSTTMSWANAITRSASVRLRDFAISVISLWLQARAISGARVVEGDQPDGACRMRRYSLIPTSRNCSSS